MRRRAKCRGCTTNAAVTVIITVTIVRSLYIFWRKKQPHHRKPFCCVFYSASALLAMLSAVLARGILSVCPSVCLSVCPSGTFRYCVQTNEDTIVRFSASGRTIPLVSGEVKFIRIFAGDHPQRGR